MVGGSVIKKINKILDVYPNIIEEYKIKHKKEWVDKIIDIDGFHTKTATAFINELDNFIQFYHKIKKIIKIESHKEKEEILGDKFKDQIIVFTGFRNNEWKKYIENNGGKVVDNISIKTTLLVYKNSESTKYQKAIKKEIKTMTVEEFKKIYCLH